MMNKELANKLYEFADLLESAGNNIYRVRAYRRAARTILKLNEDVKILLEEDFDLTSLPWIGKGISYTIKEIVRTNALPLVKNYQKKITGKHRSKSHQFMRIHHAFSVANLLLSHLRKLTGVNEVFCCGDFRRRQEIITQFDFVLCVKNPAVVMTEFKELNEVTEIIDQSENQITAFLWSGMNARLVFASDASLGTKLLTATGNDAHLTELAQIAKQRNIKLSGKSEEMIYQKLGLPFIEPELREGRGEVRAAKEHHLPNLIELKNIKGDLHCHTEETDGKETLAGMVNAAIEKGYEYIAITDHSKRLTITNGMDEKRLLKQIEQINQLQEQMKNILILKSIEVDILEDGSLDLSNDVLKELDIIVASIHSKFSIPEKQQTARIIKAMENPYFNILGHATGRLIKSRPPYLIDMPQILQAAKDNGCYIELNSQPYRLDIHDLYCKMAKEKGVKVAISSDAHSSRELNYMQFGLYQARRGWLTKQDVLNSRPWPELKKLLKQSR